MRAGARGSDEYRAREEKMKATKKYMTSRLKYRGKVKKKVMKLLFQMTLKAKKTLF